MAQGAAHCCELRLLLHVGLAVRFSPARIESVQLGLCEQSVVPELQHRRNLGALVYFKYTKFILVNAADVAQLFGSTWQPSFGDIILPLGLSFFTFQGIAYLVDVAGGEEPLHSLRDFLLFKALWPQLVAGPIIRLSEIREQIEGTRTLDYPDVAEGSRRIVFGFFKKWVLADNLAPYVDSIFGAATPPHFADAVVGAIGFGLQIYFDFSAYSDIAIGTA